MNWQPIETAPKDDGMRILVWWAGQACIACWDEEVKNWQEWYDGDFMDCEDEITHWMPLPAAPV